MYFADIKFPNKESSICVFLVKKANTKIVIMTDMQPESGLQMKHKMRTRLDISDSNMYCKLSNLVRPVRETKKKTQSMTLPYNLIILSYDK